MARAAGRGQRDTAKEILDAAIALFYRQGYQATTLRQIADEVGVQVGSLYNYISSKERLLYDIMRQIMVDLCEGVETAVQGVPEPHERISRFMRYSIRFHAERQEETFIGNTELRSLSSRRRKAIVDLRDRYEAVLREAVEAANAAGEIEVADPQLTSFAGLAICSHVATWYRADGPRTLTDITDDLCAAYGPLAPPWRNHVGLAEMGLTR
jgi:AcrR family transcriptional regulator